MANEKNILLLPGLPLVNRPGVNPEPDMWAFEVETPGSSVAAVDTPPVMIDYVHPGINEILCHSKSSYHQSLSTCPPFRLEYVVS